MLIVVLTIAGLLIVLEAIAFFARRRPWAAVVWVPPAIATLYLNMFLFPCLHLPLPAAPGPGGGGEGVFVIFVLIAWGVSLALIVPAYLSRPRGTALNAPGLCAGIALTVLLAVAGLLVASYLDARVVTLVVSDPQNRPLSGLRVSSTIQRRQWGEVSTLGPIAVTDSAGRCTLHFDAFSEAELVISGPTGAAAGPSVLHLGIARESGGSLYVRISAPGVHEVVLRQPDSRRVIIPITFP